VSPRPASKWTARLHGLAGRAWRGDVSALAAGGLYPLAFAPFGFYPAAVLSLAAIGALTAACRPARALWRGWLFGLASFGLGVSWIQVSIHQFGLPVLTFSAGVTALFIAFISLYPALFGFLAARCPRAGYLAVLGPAAAWTLSEGLRGRLLTGFPWLQAGYSQIDGPLAGFAPVTGVLGVSLAAALVAALLVQALRAPQWRPAAGCIAAACLLGLGGVLLARASWTAPAGAPAQVAISQGNVPQALKWLPDQRQGILARYRRLTARHPAADLVVWPETAVPAFPHEVREYLARLEREAARRGQGVLVGMPELDRRSGRYYNAVLAFGEADGRYRKRHLVPFGEYLPFEPWLRRFLDFLEIPMSDFEAGAPRQAPLASGGLRIGVSICYEDAFGGEVADALPAANLLVNVSNDAWFGDSLAPHQHEEIARMRALETGRPLVRATNTGVSSFIDHRGRVRGRTAQFEAATLERAVRPRSGATPYVRAGGWPVPALCLLVLAVCERRRRRAAAGS